MTDSLPQLQYPLSENADQSLKTSSGRMFGELHMDALMNDKLTEEDLTSARKHCTRKPKLPGKTVFTAWRRT